MRVNRYLTALMLSAGLVWACNDVEPTIAPSPGTEEEPGEEEEEYIEEPPDGTEAVRIDRSTTYQTIESFAASDCWMGNRVGRWSDRDRIAEYLFSDEIEDGQPRGIALSGWRFNLGAGTAQQGDASGLTGQDVRARTESFMDPVTGELDWNMALGQQFFLEKARDYGNTEQLVMFSNSPPVYLTSNNLGYKSVRNYRANIAESKYGEFGDYIAEVLNYFRESKGITFDFVSPVNEPQYDWTGGQEGSPYINTEAAGLVRAIDGSFTAKGVTGTKIMIPEAGDYTYLYRSGGSSSGLTDNQIEEFFTDPASVSYVGDLTHIAPLVAGHSYWTDGTWSELVNVRTSLANALQGTGLKFYQTEWSMLGDDPPAGFGSYGENTPGIRYGVYMSRVIHADLKYANASSWSYWTVFCLPRWDHFDRFSLIKVWPGGNLYPETEDEFSADGDWEVNKNLWVLGNYSRFVRPGFMRVELEMDDESEEFFGTAYVSPDGLRIVAVYTNLTSSDSFDVRADFGNEPTASIRVYTTDDERDLKESTVVDKYTAVEVGPLSVVTVVYDLKEKK